MNSELNLSVENKYKGLGRRTNAAADISIVPTQDVRGGNTGLPLLLLLQRRTTTGLPEDREGCAFHLGGSLAATTNCRRCVNHSQNKTVTQPRIQQLQVDLNSQLL